MYKIEDVREHDYPYNQSFLNQYPFMLTSFKSDGLPMIVLDNDEIDLMFDLATHFYRKLRRLKVLEDMKWGIVSLTKDVVNYVLTAANIGANFIPVIGQMASLLISLLQLGLEIAHLATKKFWKYPDYINELYFVIKMFVTWAKISEANKQELLSGVTNYIEMQKEEFNDLVQEEGYAELDELSIIYIMDNYLPAFKARVKKVMKKSGKDLSQAVPDINKTAPGKDDTNEIDFARNPQEENPQEKREHSNENEGKTLDSMRNRQSKEMAGSNHYDYEYSKMGFDIKLEKANEIDITKDLAQEAAVAQVVKGGVLALCSLHYCKRYKALPEYNDICEVKSHIPTDMQEQEINPSIKRFNNQIAHKQLKESQNRYKEGYQPKITHYLKLDLIDESIDRYYRDYMNLYTQLSEESKLKFNFIEMNEKKELFAYRTYDKYKVRAFHRSGYRRSENMQNDIQRDIAQMKTWNLSTTQIQDMLEYYVEKELGQKLYAGAGQNRIQYAEYDRVNKIIYDSVLKKYEVQYLESSYLTYHLEEEEYEEMRGGRDDRHWVTFYKYTLYAVFRVKLKAKLKEAKSFLQKEIGKLTTQLAIDGKNHGLPQNTTDKNLDNLIQNGML